MHKAINDPMISGPWSGAPVPNLHDPRNLQFAGGVAGRARPIENGLNGGPSYVNGDIPTGLSNYIRPTQRPPPNVTSPLFDASGPAFSSDPYHHPDHAYEGSSLGNGSGKGGSPSGLRSEGTNFELPPAYEDSSPVSSEFLARPQTQYGSTSSLSTGSIYSEQDSGQMRSLAQASNDNGGSALTPHSSTSNISANQQSTLDELDDQEEELLAYLQEHDDETAEMLPAEERDIPMSLRPHMGLPVMSQTPIDSQMRSRQGPEPSSIQRSATLAPIATRTVSEPLTTSTIRPRLPRRGNTTSPRRVTDLDRIDELDETTPLGLPIHHRGPYEVQENRVTPPVRVMPLDREQQFNPRKRVIVATTPPSAPPAPVPFKLNLNPGELLTRVPPSGSRARPPESYPPPVANQPAYHRSAQMFVPDGINSGYTQPNNGYNEWSPEQLYEDPSFIHQPTILRNLPQQPYHVDPRNNSPVSSANTSRSDLRSNVGSNPDLNAIPKMPIRQKHVSFQQPQQPSPLPQPISQSMYPPSSAASAYSASSSSLSRPPPSSADRHRPKRIVMPAPLQPQNQNFQQPVPREFNRTMITAGVPAQSTAAVIPVHESKRGNLLKKRTITGSSTRQAPSHELPQRAQSMKGLFGLGGSSGRVHVQEPEAKLTKTSRKLSKRKTAF